jgi:hypothetical protein
MLCVIYAECPIYAKCHRACIINFFTASINSVIYWVSVFVIVNNFLYTLTNTPTFGINYGCKSFMIQAPGAIIIYYKKATYRKEVLFY